MKALMVFAACLAAVSGQYDYTGPQRTNNGGSRPVYGPPQREFQEPQQQPQPLPPQQQPQQPNQIAEAYTPQVFRHVYIHTAPDDPVDQQARTIRVPGGDKHVNIIFVKTPSQSSQSQTEVILPEQDEQKNLVYVLLKKNTAENNIRVRRPPPQRQQKPEVYFIRYKDQEQQQNGGSGGYPQGVQLGNGPAPPPAAAPEPVFQGSPDVGAPSPVRNIGNGNRNIGSGNGNIGNGNGNIGNGNGNTGNGDGNTGNGNGNNGNNRYSEAGRYIPAVAPGPIRSPADVPSSGYGAPL